MSTGISSSDFVGQWSLSFADIDFINSKPTATRLGLAAQLKFFSARGFFVDENTAIPHDVAEYLAEQLSVCADELSGYDFGGRTARRHYAEILRHLGFRRMKPTDREALSFHIMDELCPAGQSVSAMLEAVFLWCRDRNICGPSAKELERLVRSQRQQYMDCWLQEVSATLPDETITLMEGSLADTDGPTGFNAMKGDAGRATLDNILEVTGRLAFIRKLDLRRKMLSNVNPAWVDQVVRRVSGEKASEMRRHTEARQLALYAVNLMARETAMTDAVVELLVETVHKIGTRSKRKVVGDIAKDVERVYGKERLLVDIATASIDDPDGRICDVIFPVVGKEKLAAIIKESNAKGALDRRIYAVMRNSWANHYRRMLPTLLSVLEFRSNNAVWRPVLSALDWIRARLDDGCRFVPHHEVPIDGVIPARWRSSVIDGNGRVNRISYELCVLTQLRECIRSKEIWVVGADRYRNPDDDLPKDFAVRRSSYYSRLNLTQNAREFVALARKELEYELLPLNETIPRNEKVRILWRGENRISITPSNRRLSRRGWQPSNRRLATVGR